jgi:hypothetical protein
MTSTTTQHLATIDALRERTFPGQRARSSTVVSGPGYHIAELATSQGFWEDDGTARLAAEEEYETECRALSRKLYERWGEPQVMSMWSVRVRSTESDFYGDGRDDGDRDDVEHKEHGEHIGTGEEDQPWLELSIGVPWLELWRAEGKWIGLGVSQQDGELPFQLLAVVTVNDPP